jgi:acetyl-CoA C-acetyltransferase
MSAIDPRTPVLVGGGQFIQKPIDPADALEPVAMMAEAVDRALHDSGAAGLAAKVDSVWVVRGAWSYRDPGRLIAGRLGLAAARNTAVGVNGGNSPQSMVNRAALDIQAGGCDVVVIAGGEGIYSRRRAKRAGATIPYTRDDDQAGAAILGEEVTMSSDLELANGVAAPINVYPLFENALRAARGEGLADHRDRIARLWQRFNAVAVDNPYAWLRTPLSADQIRDSTPDNRMVGFPYTKAMNSNWDLDQAAAVVVCSVAAAEAAGVPKDRWVFLHAGTDAHDTYLVSNRGDLHSSPAIRVASRVAFELAERRVEEVGPVDLYSCFPSAVQVAANEVGLSHERPLTVTGGLPFAGGPLNNYVTHSIATMVGVLRERAGELGLVTANGGYLTKHAIGLYSTEPTGRPFRWADVQAEVDQHPRREVAGTHDGPVTVETYTVMHDHDGPSEALLAGLTGDGRRTWARSTDPGFMAGLMASEPIGTTVEVAAGSVVGV